MSNETNVNLSDLPDLPELESVQTRTNVSLLIAFGYGSSMLWQGAIFGMMAWRYWRYLDTPGYAGLGLLAALLLWLVLRVLTGYTFFATDPQGLTMRGPLLRRFVPWIDVREARSKVRDGRTTLTLRADRGRQSINPGATGSSEGEIVIASAWQHLRRLGKTDGIELSEPARKLWEPIPDDVPLELDWGQPPKRSAKIGNAVGAAFFPALLLTMTIWNWEMSLFVGPLFIVITAVLMKSAFLPELRSVARQVLIRPDGIQAKMLFGSAYVPWSSVTAAWWQSQSNMSYLCIRSNTPTVEVRLPYSLGNRKSEQMILSVIRYLRTAGTAQAVPLPVIISKDPDYLKRAAFSSQQVAHLHRAFLSTLEPAVAKRIQGLYGLGVLLILVGLVAGAVAGLLELPGLISARIFSKPDTRYFIPSGSAILTLPLTVAGMFIGTGIAELIARKASGPHRNVWMEFNKIGSGNGRLKRALVWTFGTIAALGLLSTPLFVCCYTRITDKGIVMNRYLHFREQFYSWQQIQQVEALHKTRVHNGHTDQDVSYRVVFAGGADWEIGDDGLRAKEELLQKAMGFTARNTGRQMKDTWR